ncbi:NADPH-dependent FMN reductase [Chloroflexota bacterium]
MIHIVTIGGSARPGNYTAKALALVQRELRNLDEVVVTEIDPATLKLAIPGSAMDSSDRDWLIETVAAADGVILATPEYHGTFSSLMKLVIENLGFPSALAEKPVVLLGVASGRIGAIKSLEHLRSVCSHVGALVLPDPISVARVSSVFDEQGNCLDPAMDTAIRGLAMNLVDYVRHTTCPCGALEVRVRADTL